MMSLLWLRVAAVFYAVAGATAFPAVLYGRPRWQRVSLPAAVAGFSLQHQRAIGLKPQRIAEVRACGIEFERRQ